MEGAGGFGMQEKSLRRYVLGIEYDGSAYFGWQTQENVPTIQQTIEKALSFVANESIQIYCAGRTDKGVHALEQVAHFDTNAERSVRAWTLGATTALPPDIRVLWVAPISDDFHARYSAKARCYQYLIYNHPIRPALWRNRVSWVRAPLTLHLMQEAAQYLLGTHDFSSFRAVECQAKSPIKTIEFITLEQKADIITLTLQADAFLHHMVRNIAGVLIAIGSGQKPVEWIHSVLYAKNRTAAAVTAPPEGLYLTKITYPDRFQLSKEKMEYANL